MTIFRYVRLVSCCSLLRSPPNTGSQFRELLTFANKPSLILLFCLQVKSLSKELIFSKERKIFVTWLIWQISMICIMYHTKVNIYSICRTVCFMQIRDFVFRYLFIIATQIETIYLSIFSSQSIFWQPMIFG